MNDKKIINVTLWCFAVMVLVILLTSCAFDPYAGLQVPTATAPAITSPIGKLSPIPHRDERWAVRNEWTLTLSAQNQKAGVQRP